MLALHRYVCLVLMLAVVVVAAVPAAARAQGKLEARYTVTLAGIPIGKGELGRRDRRVPTTCRVGRAAPPPAWCAPSPSGEGSSAAHGTLHAGQAMSSVFASTIVSSHKTDVVRLTVANGVVTESKVDPPQENDRIACRSPMSTARASSIR